MTTLSREQMTEKYGSPPSFLVRVGERFTWRICRAHADVTWTSDDGGETWQKRGVMWADERNRRDLANLEQQEIQRTLK